MRRDEIGELQFIAPVESVPSILTLGILSNEGSRNVVPASVANPSVQLRRSQRFIPNGLRLHQYANLYFNARNAMLSDILNTDDLTRRRASSELCILRIDPIVLDVPGVVITEINAAADALPRWYTVGEGLPRLDGAEIYDTWWTDSIRHKQRMMAEVLVPHQVPTDMIVGAYVNAAATAANLSVVAPTLETEVNSYMFFEGPKP